MHISSYFLKCYSLYVMVVPESLNAPLIALHLHIQCRMLSWKNNRNPHKHQSLITFAKLRYSPRTLLASFLSTRLSNQLVMVSFRTQIFHQAVDADFSFSYVLIHWSQFQSGVLADICKCKSRGLFPSHLHLSVMVSFQTPMFHLPPTDNYMIISRVIWYV